MKASEGVWWAWFSASRTHPNFTHGNDAPRWLNMANDAQRLPNLANTGKEWLNMLNTGIKWLNEVNTSKEGLNVVYSHNGWRKQGKYW